MRHQYEEEDSLGFGWDNEERQKTTTMAMVARCHWGVWSFADLKKSADVRRFGCQSRRRSEERTVKDVLQQDHGRD
jgi:hypothetical protein